MLTQPTIAERQCLRGLAERVAALAAGPEQVEKRRAVRALNRLDPVPPRIYCFPEGAWLECIPPETLACENPLLRGWELRLRMALYTQEVLQDDQPLDAVFNVPWDGYVGDYGLAAIVTGTAADTAARRTYYLHPDSNLSLTSHSALGAVHYEAPLRDRRDLAKLRTPEVHVDRESSRRWLELAQELFDGMLAVRRRCHWWQTLGGIAQAAVQLRGMDTLLLDLMDEPEWVGEYFARLAAGHQQVLDVLEAEGLLGLNNGSEWIHTGGIGYSDELPAPDFAGQVRCRDLWGGAQTQDLVGISPALFAEVILPHLRPIVERFGLGCFGCCEPLHDWLPALKSIANLRRVSISPWADVRKSAEQLGNRYVLSRKPLPTPLSTEHFDAAAILHELRTDFAVLRAHDCRAEVMVKDLHTVQHEPHRLPRWVALARQARDEAYG
jgi:hypothetical protein